MNGPRSVEDYLMDLINQKYAQRIFSILRTEHEKQYLDKGREPDHGE